MFKPTAKSPEVVQPGKSACKVGVLPRSLSCGSLRWTICVAVTVMQELGCLAFIDGRVSLSAAAVVMSAGCTN